MVDAKQSDVSKKNKCASTLNFLLFEQWLVQLINPQWVAGSSPASQS
jgi:hypothetical protein